MKGIYIYIPNASLRTYGRYANLSPHAPGKACVSEKPPMATQWEGTILGCGLVRPEPLDTTFMQWVHIGIVAEGYANWLVIRPDGDDPVYLYTYMGLGKVRPGATVTIRAHSFLGKYTRQTERYVARWWTSPYE